MTDELREKIKQDIVDYIKRNKGTSFVEIERIFNANGFDYIGTLDYAMKYETLVLWGGWNNEAIDIITELEKEKQIKSQASYQLIYLIDGKALSYPIAKKVFNYKEPHWLPVVFNVWKD